ncbi:MAG: replication initiation protein, partial [Gammaproteobacteria bacterium]|nr:replication initiation protein [Gammaproteobacteria bacterium]
MLGDSIPEMELEGWNASTILSSVSVQKGIIKYQYSELIKTLLIDPKIYGKINLAIQARFKSSYALALYENCSRYRGLPYTKNIDIDIFRKLMGVEDGKYDIFRDFNRRVLNPAITEINTCSDIRVSPEITRMGRVVKSIKFKIEERAIKQRIGVSDNTVQKNLSVSAERDIFKELKNAHGEDKVEKAIQYVQSRPSYKNGEIKNVVGYVASAINNDYQEKKTDTKKKSELTDTQKRNVSWLLHKTDYLRHIT